MSKVLRSKTKYGILVCLIIAFSWHLALAERLDISPTTEPSGSVFVYADTPIDISGDTEYTSWIKSLITRESLRYGVDPAVALALAEFESGFNPTIQNREGSSAKGLYQFIDSTWESLCEGEVTDPYDNTICFMRLASEGKWSHWTVDPRTANVLADLGIR